ncbi:DUF2188 domain-containing protein [Sphingobium rhizovicinum]|uniref:DUF2188 domain-containing protein n=1 Tax=Sphingobium rhizovicinum TaxID=432308 RepID=A0ABV7ND77_9SPHN
MSAKLPHARYIVLEHEGVWKINLDNKYYGPFPTQDQAVQSAMATAQKAADAGYPASLLLMRGTQFDILWTNVPA